TKDDGEDDEGDAERDGQQHAARPRRTPADHPVHRGPGRRPRGRLASRLVHARAGYSKCGASSRFTWLRVFVAATETPVRSRCTDPDTAVRTRAVRIRTAEEP